MPIDPSIPLQAQGAPDNFGKLMQVAQFQQMGQAQQQKRNEMRDAKKVKEMAARGSGLFMRYQSLKDQGFSEQAAHAAMQEDWQREIGGLASLRDDNGAPLFDQQELGQFGQEFNAGQLGMVLPKLIGADRALDLHFQSQKSKLEADDKAATRKHQSDTLAETRRHNMAVEGAPKAGQRPVAVADPKSSTGFTYQTPEGAVGQPAPAPRAQNNTKYSAKELQDARSKMRLIQTAKQQLQEIKAAREKLRGAWSMGGPGGVLPTEAGSNFDGAVDTFRSTVEGITRTPGIGAQSDFEARLNQAKLPSRKEYESTADNKIRALENLINGLESGYGDLLNEGEQPGAQAPGSEQDILDAADAILNGE